MYELIDENNLNLCGKRIFRQAIEHPETAYKQIEIRKMSRNEKKQETTRELFGSRSKKSLNKEGVTEAGYNEQIFVDNKNGLIIAVGTQMMETIRTTNALIE
ncbi:MAG: hypothetical protein IJJ47_03450 [Methanosphaera sp.]|nr:hypothetical protein [Methanosphaera sp.]